MVLYTDCMSVFLAAIQQSFVDSCFYVHIMEKPFSSLKKKGGGGEGKGLSQVVLHMSTDNAGAGKNVFNIFQICNHAEVISLMVKAGGFTGTWISKWHITYKQRKKPTFTEQLQDISPLLPAQQ